MWWRKLPFDGSLQGKPQVEHRRHSGGEWSEHFKKEMDIRVFHFYTFFELSLVLLTTQAHGL